MTDYPIKPWSMMKGVMPSVAVYKVVSKLSLRKIIDSSQMKAVRGVYKDRDVYIWDSYYAIHKDFQEAFGPGMINFEIWQHDGQEMIHFHTITQKKTASHHMRLVAVIGDYL